MQYFFARIKHILKHITKQQIYSTIFILGILSINIYIYFQLSLIITPDSSHYYFLSDIVTGFTTITNWDRVRGFSFPLIIAISRNIFGSTPQSMLITSYLYYLLLNGLFLYFMFKYLKLNNKFYELKKYILLYIVIFLFNPLIIGYGHTLLTESITPTFYFITIMMCYKWYSYDFKSKKQFFYYMFMFIILAIFIWFIKQPYAPAFYFAIGITSLLYGIKKKSWKLFFSRFIVIIVCIFSTILSIKIWNTYLNINGNEIENKDNSFLSKGLIDGINYHYRKSEIVCSKKYINKLYLSNTEKNSINNLIEKDEEWCNHIINYNIVNKEDKIVKNSILYKKKQNPTLKENLNFLFYNLMNNPKYVLGSYYHNYFGIIDINKTILDKDGYHATGSIENDVNFENEEIGIRTFYKNTKTCWWMYWNKLDSNHQQEADLMKNFVGYTTGKESVKELMLIHYDFIKWLFKILLLSALPLFIYSLIKFIKNKNENYFLICLLSGTSFGHLMFHVLMGAIIDRYAYVVYPLMLLCLFILLIANQERTKYGKK